MPKIGDLFVQIGADIGALDRELRKAGQSFERFGKDLRRIGLELSKTITLPIAGFATLALKASEDASAAFENFHEKTKKTMGTLGDEIFAALNVQGMLDSVSGGLQTTTQWFSSLSQEVKTGVIVFTAWLAVTPLLILGLGQMSLVISGLIKLVNLLAITMSAHPILAFATILATITAAVLLYKSSVDSAASATANLHSHMAAIEVVDRKVRDSKEDLNRAYQVHGDRIRRAREEIQLLQDANQRLAHFEGEAALAQALTNERRIRQLQDLIQQMEEANLQAKGIGDAFEEAAAKLGPFIYELGKSFVHTFESIAQSVGNAIAQLIVYGGNVGKMFAALGKNILASFISAIITIGIEWLALSLLGKHLTASHVTREVAAASATAAAWAAAHAIIEGGLIGLLAAAGIGAAAATTVAAASVVGAGIGAGTGRGIGTVAALAGGGLVRGPLLGLVGEAGPEVVTPLDRFEEMLGINGGRGQTIIVELDGEIITRRVVTGMPAFLRFRGAV